MSSTEVSVKSITPAGSSITDFDPEHIDVILKGFMCFTILTTLLSLPTNKTSIEKRIKKVCIELAGRNIID